MRARRLADGTLLAPRSAVSDDGVIGDALVEIPPDDPAYAFSADEAESSPG